MGYLDRNPEAFAEETMNANNVPDLLSLVSSVKRGLLSLPRRTHAHKTLSEPASDGISEYPTADEYTPTRSQSHRAVGSSVESMDLARKGWRLRVTAHGGSQTSRFLHEYGVRRCEMT